MLSFTAQFHSPKHFANKKTSNKLRFFLGTCNEPPLPRRKKCPELAYKTHEFINCDQSASTNYRNDNNSINRARVRNYYFLSIEFLNFRTFFLKTIHTHDIIKLFKLCKYF